MENRADIRGTSSYAAQALKNQPQFFIDSVNQARLKKGLSVVNVRGRDWDECTPEERANIKAAQTADRIHKAKEDRRLAELEAELRRLKAELAAAGRES